MDQLIKTLDDIFVKKAPFQLPENVKEWIVKYLPIIDIVILVIFLPFILAAFAISMFALPFAPVAAHTGFTVAWLFGAAYFVLRIIALPGLFGRKKQGWMLLFYAMLLNLVGDVISFHIVGGLIGAVVWTYFLMQVRSKYN